MNDTQVYIVNAFTDALFGGNPAAVVPVKFAMSDELMQSIAAQHNLSETAFPECLGPDRFNLRWFTPQKEVPLCGHATLATAYACLLYTSPSPRDLSTSRMPSSA